MCIYCGTTKYRKIYENHYGPIPKDENDRLYEIHHIDGNHSNNDPENLKAVTIQEHYDIHYSQGDFGACLLISRNMKISPNEKSELARQNALRLVREGKHPLTSGEVQRKANKERIANGTHHLLGPDFNKRMLSEGKHPSQNYATSQAASIREKKRVEEGTHHLLNKQWQKEKCRKTVESGKHNFIGGEIQRKTGRRLVENGTHIFIQQWKCEVCGKEGKNLAVFSRWHGNNCKKINK